MSVPSAVGDPAPWFTAPVHGGIPDFSFNQAGGRVVLMLFPGSVAHPAGAAAAALIAKHRVLFDDANISLFGVSLDPADAAEGRIEASAVGLRWFLDHDGRIARLYGAIVEEGGKRHYRPHWLLLDRQMRVVSRFGLADGERIVERAAALARESWNEAHAPVLIVPRVFDRALCRRLIGLYDARGGSQSGFMREVDGVTIGLTDHSRKRRSDCTIDEEELCAEIRMRLRRALLPQVERAFHFAATRIERYIVACYDDRDGGGFFRPHRDNTTRGTAHRRFACTINLNADDYEGGDLSFPEYGPRLYRAPTGGAVVFSCSLLHEARRVRRGRRYAFLPFFYDEAGAQLRQRNEQYLAVAAPQGDAASQPAATD